MEKLIKKAFFDYKIDYKEEDIEKICKFADFVLAENEKFNLTAITEKRDFVFKHILDSALGASLFAPNAKVVDVGSGAGFPGIILKILRPDLDILLVDSLQKRVNFLNSVISMLNLQKISAKHTRVEDLANNFLTREKFNFATARAVASLSTLCEYLLPLVKVGGSMIAYKSAELETEIKSSKYALKILGGTIERVVERQITEISSARKIAIIKKTAQTPSAYPRPKNKPKLQPL